MPKLPPRLRRWLFNRYTAFLLFIAVFTTVEQLLGGLSSFVYHIPFEGPLLLYLYWLLNAIQRQDRWTPWLAGLPIVCLYGLYDGFFLGYGEVFRVVNFNELPELMQVLPLPHKTLLIGTLFVPLLLVLLRVDLRRYRHALVGSVPALLLGANTQFGAQQFVSAFDAIGTDVVVWSDELSVENNGRFAMLFYFEAQRRVALAQSATYRDRAEYAKRAEELATALREHGAGRHVHLVVLESFIDPTLFKGVQYSRDPRHPAYVALFGKNVGYSLSPVFGGGTAQAEFEVLCGVPAFHALSSIEFNAFTGAPAYCMPGLLKEAGYRTLASNAYKPNFFNAIKAYTGIGFAEAYFPIEYASQRNSYISAAEVPPGEQYLFDGELFAQNLDFIGKAVQENPGRPILNYVLSMYGHFPHTMDPQLRPRVLSMKAKYRDEQLLLAANQHYYRTEAIAAYVRKLSELDPKSLIVLISDHLPPLEDGTGSYKRLGYLANIEDSTFYNRILVVEDGKPRRYRNLHHFDVPSIVFNYLTDGWYCKNYECNLLRTTRERAGYYERYMRLMAHAVETQP
ncbi:MAG: sulfatase-like hydrolase/transferase [Candidatus Methylophosphatis roskildensis]